VGKKKVDTPMGNLRQAMAGRFWGESRLKADPLLPILRDFVMWGGQPLAAGVRALPLFVIRVDWMAKGAN